MAGAVLQAPRLIKWLTAATPVRLQQVLFARSLNYALRNLIAAGELEFFKGKVLNIGIKDWAAEFSIVYRNGALMVTDSVAQADLRFSASSYDLLLIASQRLDPDTLFFLRRLEMNGDTELGLGIKNLLASMELEQQLNPRLARQLLRLADVIERYRAPL